MLFLRSFETIPDRVTPGRYPFNIPCLAGGLSLTFKAEVTFLVGENGSGKSTILEAIAEKAGFNLSGGNRDHQYLLDRVLSDLATATRLTWNQKTAEGFFMRAETFFNFATYLEDIGSTFRAYGGKSLHDQSHGESFLSLFTNRFESGLYILDEPEAALSPARQLSFLAIIHDLEASGHAQFIIATHSPIILSYPGATILSLDGDQISEIEYKQTSHYILTRDFLQCPERYLRRLFADSDDET
ncbi:MAG TPA: AAA family ATPase [Blastocatellia bacterium]|nr:AAA family ATPase [Blastocatellia bacterium]